MVAEALLDDESSDVVPATAPSPRRPERLFPNPGLLLNSDTMSTCIRRLRSNFDHVILDGPPMLGFADSTLLALNSDGVLFVVESGKTRRRAVLEALSRMRAVGGRVLGVALTKHVGKSGEYGYRYEEYAKNYALAVRPQPHELTPALLAGRDES